MGRKPSYKFFKQVFSNKNIILTTGGTAGHIVPAMKVVSDLLEENKNIYFITDNRFENYRKLFESRDFFSSPNFHIIKIPIVSFSERNKMRFFYAAFISLFKSFFLTLKIRPKIVIGFGSYVSFFPLLAAMLTFRRIILHEQNVIFGKVNRFFLRASHCVLLSFPDVSFFSQSIYKIIKNKYIISGLPTFLEDSKHERASSVKVIYDISTKEEVVILVTGGGQGASFFSAHIPEGLLLLAKSYPQKNFVVYQQVKKGEIESILKLYTEAGTKNLILHIKPLFENMEELLAKADFAIIRGGAASIVETSLSKVFPIMIPMPNSAGGHQEKNSSVLSKNNAGVLLKQEDFSPHKLFFILSRAINDGLFYFPIINNAYELFKKDAHQTFKGIILYSDLTAFNKS
jgi:UDP-N-acetylglucosamine--N-acetylmuramyl-(pentapeptide) pyrophosphoryl-undecaprenol N-acetylglucosamine transferase